MLSTRSNKLSEEDRAVLWKKYRETNDKEFRNQLVEEYSYLVEIIAKKVISTCGGENVEFEDLCSHGILGLMEAIDRFDINGNTSFQTYASLRVRGEMIDSMRRDDWVPRTLRARQKQMEKAENTLMIKGVAHPKPKEVAEELNISESELTKWKIQSMGVQSMLRLDATADADDHETLPFVDMIPQTTYDLPGERLYKEDDVKVLAAAIDELSEKERLTISLIYYEGLNMAQTAEVLGVSQPRISQLHAHSIKKLREKVGNLI